MEKRSDAWLLFFLKEVFLLTEVDRAPHISFISRIGKNIAMSLISEFKNSELNFLGMALFATSVPGIADACLGGGVIVPSDADDSRALDQFGCQFNYFKNTIYSASWINTSDPHTHSP